MHLEKLKELKLFTYFPWKPVDFNFKIDSDYMKIAFGLYLFKA